MKLARKLPSRRLAFTLIELLVVITIIAILIGLISSAIYRALAKGPQVVNKNAITQLGDGIVAFQTKYSVSYVPSRLILCERFSDYAPFLAAAATNQLAQDSIDYLTRAWPRLNSPGGPWLTSFVNWDGSVNAVNVATYSPPVLLEGDQCLVFFLGGIPSGNFGGVPGTQGFSTNPANPAAVTADRVGPFYEFKANQLVLIHGNVRFFSCADGYAQTNSGALTRGNVFAYFSSYKTANGYPRYPGSDCASIGAFPYIQAGTPALPNYFNPSSFQIHSAGADFIFGPGGFLPPNGGTSLGAGPGGATPVGATSPGNGKDDQTNFHDGLLGSY